MLGDLGVQHLCLRDNLRIYEIGLNWLMRIAKRICEFGWVDIYVSGWFESQDIS